jgi:hypothetical protein
LRFFAAAFRCLRASARRCHSKCHSLRLPSECVDRSIVQRLLLRRHRCGLHGDQSATLGPANRGVVAIARAKRLPLDEGLRCDRVTFTKRGKSSSYRWIQPHNSRHITVTVCRRCDVTGTYVMSWQSFVKHARYVRVYYRYRTLIQFDCQDNPALVPFGTKHLRAVFKLRKRQLPVSQIAPCACAIVIWSVVIVAV